MINKNTLLKALPKVDECITLLKKELSADTPTGIIKSVVQRSIELERGKILHENDACRELTKTEWLRIFQENITEKLSINFRRVINGTGVVIHTNLGRSILSRGTTDRLAQAGGYYSNLEFSLDSGNRGSRYRLVEDLIC